MVDINFSVADISEGLYYSEYFFKLLDNFRNNELLLLNGIFLTKLDSKRKEIWSLSHCMGILSQNHCFTAKHRMHDVV